VSFELAEQTKSSMNVYQRKNAARQTVLSPRRGFYMRKEEGCRRRTWSPVMEAGELAPLTSEEAFIDAVGQPVSAM
jgi:hypothetical protein